jgi:saccharopine dehydrogenase-like NADP-dependent oxidoreductase
MGLLDFKPRKVGEGSVIPVDVFLSGPGVAEPKEGSKLLDWACVRVIIKGEISGRKGEYVADVLQRPYRNLGAMQLITGIPAAIGIHMVARGDITQKGCYSTTDDAVDAEIFFGELSRRECQISYRYTEVLY